jgi:hypothetical protein
MSSRHQREALADARAHPFDPYRLRPLASLNRRKLIALPGLNEDDVGKSGRELLSDLALIKLIPWMVSIHAVEPSITLAPTILCSVAAYVEDGEPMHIDRGAYTWLHHLSPDIRAWFCDRVGEAVSRAVEIEFVHDTTRQKETNMSVTMSVEELAYTETLQLTGETNFGIGMQAAMSGAQAIPPEGLWLDFPFQGELVGKIAGQIAGMDCAVLRGDGVGLLHVHAIITTEDGERISFFGDGVALFEPGSPIAQLRENVTLYTASPKHSWVNRLQFWATGSIDLSIGQGTLKGYSA